MQRGLSSRFGEMAIKSGDFELFEAFFYGLFIVKHDTEGIRKTRFSQSWVDREMTPLKNSVKNDAQI